MPQPAPQPCYNEKNLVEKARAAQLERERQASDERNLQKITQQSHELTLDYMCWWARKFPAMAQKAGLPYRGIPSYKKSWLLLVSNAPCVSYEFYITAYGELRVERLRRGGTTLIRLGAAKRESYYKENLESVLTSMAHVDGRRSPPFSEVEMRQRVDKLFEDALMGNPRGAR